MASNLRSHSAQLCINAHMFTKTFRALDFAMNLRRTTTKFGNIRCNKNSLLGNDSSLISLCSWSLLVRSESL